jgi:NAD(P)-dependent dehydrogenase (short-subunit alcohol dehydrogenase family)
MQLSGNVALITGAGSGIGRAAAVLLAREGARIGALDTDADDLRAVVEQIQQDGGAALPLSADVAEPDAMQAAVQRLVAEWGRIDIVFANAGINGVWAPLEELAPEEWDQTLRVNLNGTSSMPCPI